MEKKDRKRKWTPEKIKASALQYKTRFDWAKGQIGAYGAAGKLGIRDECCEHMDVIIGKWTRETLAATTLKFKSKSEWAKAESGAYYAALRLGVVNQCCDHMNNRNA